MASWMRSMARQYPTYIVKAKTETAWETTSDLWRRYLATSMEAMPARIEAARGEIRWLKEKLWRRDVLDHVSVQEVATAAICAGELAAWYYGGRIIGSGAFQMY